MGGWKCRKCGKSNTTSIDSKFIGRFMTIEESYDFDKWEFEKSDCQDVRDFMDERMHWMYICRGCGVAYIRDEDDKLVTISESDLY